MAAILLVLAHSAMAQTIPSAPGRDEIPNTHLRDQCPANDFRGTGYPFHDACGGVTTPQNSAVFDTKRNRLILWGGGHQDYS
jgi:hypothetical protein